MKKIFVIAVFVLLIATFVSAQVQVSGSNGADGTYTTLGAAFSAINANTQSGNNITITITGDTTETTTAVLNQGGWATLTIVPSGARTISGNIGGAPLIDLNGADNVTINGINSGGNSLTIVNNSTSNASGTSTIRLQTDATNNTITNCTILGASTTASTTNGGTIWIGANASTTGNDNNTISNNYIGPAGTNLPTKAIYGNGSTSTTAVYNTGIIISGNNIYDYFSASAASIGIYISGGNDNWTISNNKFYQTAPRTQTTGALHAAVQVASSTGNNSHTFTGNIIGYSSDSGTGTYSISLVGTSGRFIGILVSSAGGAGTYSFQGNVITAISVTGSSSGTSTSAPFAGILMSSSSGAANYGTTAPNVIGSSTTPASITFSTTSTSSADVYGIYHFPTSNCNMTNNVVGGINVSNTTTAALVFYGLRQFTGTSQTNIFVNNKVGTASAPIQVSSSGTGSRVVGIYSQSGITTMIGNTVNNISINSPNTGTGTSASAIGIWISSTASGHNIEANTVENVTNTNSTAAVSVSGIVYDGGGTGVVQRNLIRGLATPNTTSSAGIVAGISVTSGTTTFRNNMIALGSGMSNSPQIRGIDESGGTNNFYYNSVYISGTATSGSGNSHAFHSTVTVNARNYRNNIFYNGRSNSGGATGTHYAIRVGGTGTNPTGLTSNNNILYFSGAGGVLGFYDGSNRTTLNDWQTATGQDASSIFADPLFVSTSDLHINASSPAVNQAFDVGVINDFDGQVRPGLNAFFDIGADETDGLSNDIAATAFVSPQNGGYVPLGVAFSPQASFTNNATTQSNVPVRYRVIDSSNTTICDVTSTITSIAGGQTVTVTFPSCTVSATGTYTIKATAENPGDQVPSNDEITGTIVALSPFSGTYTVGSGGNFSSLTNPGGIFDAINGAGATGNITIEIISDLSGETGQIGLNQISGGHSILIKPSGGARTITSTATATRLIFLNGADNVTIDGSLSGGTDRSLTLSLANSTTAGTTVIWVGSLGAGQGASNVTIRNCIIQNGTNFGSSTSANFGIFVGHANGSANGPDNDNLTIQNNLIQKTSIGIQAVGDTTGLNDNMLIADNTLGGTATADYLGRNGIVIGHTTNSTVTRNIVRNIANSTPTNLFGIVASTGTTNTSITRNSVSNMNASNSGGYGSNGITISTGSSSSNVTVANNFIYDLRGTSYTTIALGDTIAGIRITGTTGGVNVWHNSVNLSGNYAGFNGATVTAAFMVNTTTATNLDVRNNIFANSFDNTTVTTDKNYAIYTNAAATMFSQINYNDYYVSGAQGVLGAINSTDRTTLSALQAATGQDLNSMNVDPSFTSSTDLHLLPLSLVNGMGTAISGVGIDYDNDARSATAPDIGADELVGSTGGVFPSGTFYNASVSSGDTFSGNVTVTGVLYISGPVNVGANTITLGCDANYSFVVGPPISYIIGNLAKQFCTTGAFTFPVGTADPLEYTPVDVNVTAIGVTPSTLTVSATDQAMTGLVPSRSISRYWSLTETGDITAFLTFNYLDNAGEDVPPTANESDFRIYRKSGSIITNLCPSSPCVNTTANSATTPTAVTDFSDWSIGEQVATSEPVNVSGRVITREGRPIARARVTVTNQEGETIITHTNHFGYYRFRELRSGQVYVFTVSHKLYRFSQPSQVRFISQDEDGIDFVADGMNEGVNPAETYFDRAPFDFDGDRKTDLSVWRAEEGAWYIRRSSDNKWQMQKFGLSTDEIAPADYDGDGRTDIAIFRASEGRWYVLMSESEELYVENFGRIGDLAMPSDYDGDGKADIAVWREEESSYYIRRSSDGKLIVQQIELKGKVRPVVGDVDGDGRADLGGYTTSGVLKIFLSRTGDTVTDTVEGEGTLILADFDGDARADKAVYLAKRGVWKVTTSGFTETVEAFAGGRASPGDYDGDGRVDVAVYLNGKWQMKQSASGIVRNNVFGLTTDIPIPSAYSR